MHKEVNIDVRGGIPERKTKMELEKRSDNIDERLNFVEDRKMPWLHIAKNFKDHRHLIYNISYWPLAM